jgi:aspartyl-tRNA(Asn)/glutamyl-tRNA(Gln) amidotransferase subunit B
MRTKEDAHDYRYFPDPDLMPIVISQDQIKKLTAQLPQLPDDRKAIYIKKYDLSAYDAEQLVSSREMADYFEEATVHCSSTKILANLINSEVVRLLGDDEELLIPPFKASLLRSLVNLIDDETINVGIGKKVLGLMWTSLEDPLKIIEAHDLKQISDPKILMPLIEDVLKKSTKAVADYKAGKEKALLSIVGQIMASTKGKANPRVVNELIEFVLKESTSES